MIPLLPVTAARRVLFVRTDRLGETLLNLPAIVALKHALPHASLTLLVHPDLQALMASFPVIDHVVPYPHPPAGPWWIRAHRLSRTLASRQFDLAILSNPMKELHLAVWLARIPIRVGYNRKWGWLLTHRLQDRKALGERHEVEYNLDLVRALGFQTTIPPWQFPCFEREQADVFRFLEAQGAPSSRPLIAIHPWTSNPLKRWPLEWFRALLERLSAQGSVIVVVIGAAQEQQQATALLTPEIPRVVNLAGRLSLTQLAGLFERARLLVSNDSGPMHLAAAVGTPVVALFGTEEPGSHPTRWGPVGAGHRVFHRRLTDISVDEVYLAVKAYLT